MKTKIEIKSFLGRVLFTYENENATIKDALEKAIKEKTDLRSANLSSADLSSANLSSADLSSANLSFADLRFADLSSANLSSADLRSADLSSANLSFADLRFANLSSADLSSADLRSADLSSAENKDDAYIPLFCKWSFSIKGDKIQIGCKEKTSSEWEEFFNSTETYSTERGTDDFKQIQACYEACKSYINFLNK